MSQWRELVHIRATYVIDDGDDHYMMIGGIGYEMYPIDPGAKYSLVAYLEADEDLLRVNVETLEAIFASYRTEDKHPVSLLTIWECEAGTSYIPGEPDEWDANVQLVGHLHPETFVEVLVQEAPGATE